MKQTIPPNVTGRIDHIDTNFKDPEIHVAALGNNSLKVIDLKNSKAVHSIKALYEPRGEL